MKKSERDTTSELNRFDDVMRKILSVSNKELQSRERKYKRGPTKKKQALLPLRQTGISELGRSPSLLESHPGQVSPQSRLPFFRNGLAAVFGAEDQMDMVPGKGMCHSVAPLGLYGIAFHSPPLPLHFVQGKRGGLRSVVPDGTGERMWRPYGAPFLPEHGPTPTGSGWATLFRP